MNRILILVERRHFPSPGKFRNPRRKGHPLRQASNPGGVNRQKALVHLSAPQGRVFSSYHQHTARSLNFNSITLLHKSLKNHR